MYLYLYAYICIYIYISTYTYYSRPERAVLFKPCWDSVIRGLAQGSPLWLSESSMMQDSIAGCGKRETVEGKISAKLLQTCFCNWAFGSGLLLIHHALAAMPGSGWGAGCRPCKTRYKAPPSQ